MILESIETVWKKFALGTIKTIFISVCFLIAFYANSSDLISISFGPVHIGESRIPLDLKDFQLKIEMENGTATAEFRKDSVEWIRSKDNLLTPRALLKIVVTPENDEDQIAHLVYLGKSVIPENINGKYVVELYVSLFNPSKIFINYGANEVGSIWVKAKKPKTGSITHVIDYSCSRYGLTIEGMKDEYISVGCRLERMGKFGGEVPRLIISWAATNYYLLDGSKPPYVTRMTGPNSIKVKVADQKGEERVFKIKASIPKRLYRLKTAFGFGPYLFKTGQGEHRQKEKWAPTFMLYGNLHLAKGSSFRMFDALIFRNSIFNNFGLYFAYDLATLFDHRIQVVPLIGFQGLSFKFDHNAQWRNRMIYPQGFEVVFKHVFGIENYLIVYGMFVSMSREVDYQNIWVRWGQKYFWELNYINWGQENMNATMWGLSIGLPLAKLF